MALWLVRAGKYGEYEERFLDEGRIYLTWHELTGDLHKQATKDEVRDLLWETYPTNTTMQIAATLPQIWAFTHIMEKGDWIGTPSALNKAVIHFGEIKGDYIYHPSEEAPFFHSRDVEWFATDTGRRASESPSGRSSAT